MKNALGDDYKVVYYFNGVMDGYSRNDQGVSTLEDKYQATIEGGTVLKFTTTHFRRVPKLLIFFFFFATYKVAKASTIS